MEAYQDRIDRLPADRRELLTLWLAQEDDQAAAAGHAPYAKPRTPVESSLARLWRDVLDVERVGIDDDYFQLGGDSIVAIVIVSKAKQAGILLSTHDLFGLRTIRRIADGVRQAVPSGQDPPGASGSPAAGLDGGGQARASAPPGEYPLTPMQEGMLFHTLADPHGAAYVVQVTCRLDGDLNHDQFSAAWQAMAERHSMLRTYFRLDGDAARQVVAPAVHIPVEVRDWRSADPSPVGPAVTEYLAQDRRRAFDPARPPLLRVALLQITESACLFVLTHHHLLLDGWSQQLLLRELLDLYDGLEMPPGPVTGLARRDGSAGLGAVPPVRPPFSSYLAWMGGQDLTDAQRYWRGRLDGFRPALIAPAAAPGRTEPTSAVSDVLTGQTSDALVSFARQHQITVGTVLAGGWAAALAQCAGSPDVAFGLTVSGRPPELPGATEMLGMFINTLPLRVQVPTGAPLLPWLRALQRQQEELTRYQHTPLALVAKCLPGQPSQRLFDSILVIENFPELVTEGAASRRLAVSDVRADIDEGYPVVLEVRPRPPLELKIRYGIRSAGTRAASGMLASLRAYAQLIAEKGPGAARVSLNEITVVMTEAAARQAGIAQAQRVAAQRRRLLGARRQPAGSGAANYGGTDL